MKMAALRSSIRKPKAKVRRRKRSYVKTPARLAASLANLEKALAAPKALVYRPTVKRLRASHANLVKALQVKQERQRAGEAPVP